MVSVAVIACSVVFSLGVTVTTIPFTKVVNCSDLSVAASIVQPSALAAVTVTVLALSVAAKESDVGSSLVIAGSVEGSPMKAATSSGRCGQTCAALLFTEA